MSATRLIYASRAPTQAFVGSLFCLFASIIAVRESLVLTLSSVSQTIIWVSIALLLLALGFATNLGLRLHQKSWSTILPSIVLVVIADACAFVAFKVLSSNSQGNELLSGISIAITIAALCWAFWINTRLLGIIDGFIVLVLEAFAVAAVAVFLLAVYFVFKITIPSGKKHARSK